MSFDKIRKIIAKNLSVSEDKVTMEADFVNDLGADSIDLVEIYMDLEDEFNTSIPDQDLPNIKTVGDLVKFIDSKLA